MSHRSIVAVLVLSTALIGGGAYATGTQPASLGFADDSSLVSCFQRSFQNPGQVSYNCTSPAGAWWDMPAQVTATGTKTLSVYINSAVQGALHDECDAFVLAGNGTISRWTSKTIQNTTGWVSFTSLAVNAQESVQISCSLTSTALAADYVSAISGM